MSEDEEVCAYCISMRCRDSVGALDTEEVPMGEKDRKAAKRKGALGKDIGREKEITVSLDGKKDPLRKAGF